MSDEEQVRRTRSCLLVVRPVTPQSPASRILGISPLERRSVLHVSSSTMFRRVGILIFAVAFVAAAGNTTLRSSSWVLCVGSQGHLAIEMVGGCCVPGPSVAQTTTSQSWVTQDCGQCTDYPIAIAARATPARGQSQGIVLAVSTPGRIMEFYAPPCDLPAPFEAPAFRSSPGLASPAPLRC